MRFSAIQTIIAVLAVGTTSINGLAIPQEDVDSLVSRDSEVTKISTASIAASLHAAGIDEAAAAEILDSGVIEREALQEEADVVERRQASGAFGKLVSAIDKLLGGKGHKTSDNNSGATFAVCPSTADGKKLC
jgi:hypothetical protein